MSGTDTDDQKALKAKVAEWGPHAVPIANLQPAVLEHPPPSRYPPPRRWSSRNAHDSWAPSIALRRRPGEALAGEFRV